MEDLPNNSWKKAKSNLTKVCTRYVLTCKCYRIKWSGRYPEARDDLVGDFSIEVGFDSSNGPMLSVSLCCCFHCADVASAAAVAAAALADAVVHASVARVAAFVSGATIVAAAPVL